MLVNAGLTTSGMHGGAARGGGEAGHAQSH